MAQPAIGDTQDQTTGPQDFVRVEQPLPPNSGVIRPRGIGNGCSCGGGVSPAGDNYPFVYAIGRVEHRFPTPGVEKEFFQVRGRTDTKGQSDRQVLQQVITRPENRYLARQLCWVFSVSSVETYLLRPRDPGDLQFLMETVRPNPRPTDIDVVIGQRGPIAPPQLCNGLLLPVVVFDQLYSFDVDSLLKAIPKPEAIAADKFAPLAEDLLWRLLLIADNAGATDEHRALNYLAVRYDKIYAKVAERFGENYSLTEVSVQPSQLGGTRNIVEVIFSFTHRETDVIDKHFVRVDVTEEFPFLVSKLSPYYDR